MAVEGVRVSGGRLGTICESISSSEQWIMCHRLSEIKSLGIRNKDIEKTQHTKPYIVGEWEGRERRK